MVFILNYTKCNKAILAPINMLKSNNLKISYSQKKLIA